MTPHFEAEGIRLFHGDCMEGMKLMPDKAYELAIVDPPYMVNMSGGKAPKDGFKSLAHWDKMKKWDIAQPSKEYFKELFRVSVNQIIWGANYLTENLPPSMGWVFWYKMQDNFSFSDGELAFTSFDCKMRIFKYARGMESGFAPGGCAYPNIHPTQKPVRLYQWLLLNYAKPGDKILDTHAGSCSSVIACNIMGYPIDAYEIDKDYLDAAVQRIKKHPEPGGIKFISSEDGMSIWMMKGLLAAYVVIMAVCLAERDWKLALYWLGASILQSSVIWMR